MSDELLRSFKLIEEFAGNNPTVRIGALESLAASRTSETMLELLWEQQLSPDVWQAARLIKSLSGQINVILHAVGILRCLPKILVDGETVQAVSLGAGNTGKKFDLETSNRIAEFKFIDWKGGSESIRQNGVFKDFFLLESEVTEKKKELYLTGTEHAERFLRGKRSLTSILSKDRRTSDAFEKRFGGRYKTVGEYYEEHSQSVKIIDATSLLD